MAKPRAIDSQEPLQTLAKRAARSAASWVKNKNIPFLLFKTDFISTTFPKNQALGSSLLSAYSWLSMALDLTQMVLEVRKCLKPN